MLALYWILCESIWKRWRFRFRIKKQTFNYKFITLQNPPNKQPNFRFLTIFLNVLITVRRQQLPTVVSVG